ncbi:hypothetical protein ABZ776_38070 [Streptomyces sp. NPDC007076]|uniref:hypothetical protein n=1 Tax=unclassified Streptomyces TaxID=2593676 RepID=UPI00224E5B2A|nr:hypothetical protein [Streptomyces sp. NBC_01500]
MSQIAREALDRGSVDFQSLSNGPAATDVWIDARLGLVLMAHRRDDGLVAEELYQAVRDDSGQWSECDHLNGGITGVDIESPEAVAQALTGSFMEIVSESTSLIFTGCADDEEAEEEDCDEGAEGLELLRILNVLVGDRVDVIELEYLTHSSSPALEPRIREVASPLVLIVLLPGQRVRVSPARRDGASTSRLGQSWEIAN